MTADKGRRREGTTQPKNAPTQKKRKKTTALGRFFIVFYELRPGCNQRTRALQSMFDCNKQISM
jgi:hypothetical protein